MSAKSKKSAGQVLVGAMIKLPKGVVRDCFLQSWSSQHAHLLISDATEIEDFLEIRGGPFARPREAVVLWRGVNEIGVMFESHLGGQASC